MASIVSEKMREKVSCSARRVRLRMERVASELSHVKSLHVVAGKIPSVADGARDENET